MLRLILILIFVLFLTLPLFAQVDTAWVRRYNGPGNSDDCAYVVAVDDSGNVYVAGSSWGKGTGLDLVTVKFDPHGDTAWVARYNGPGNSEDFAMDLFVDPSGYVYVTGGSVGSGTYRDYVTIKYYPNGDTAWVRRYKGIEDDGYDYATAIAVDDSGNVYVTGHSGYNPDRGDYATIKYYPNGDTAWVRRYNGLGDGDDWAADLAVDAYGNVYVTGQAVSRSSNDYTTIKYYPNGDTAWLRRYNGPGDFYDDAEALAIDSSGDVYVTGWSYGGSQTSNDYATVKYYPNGDTAWVRRYNGPMSLSVEFAYAIAVDRSGNVYVTGCSGSPFRWDYATIKYYPDGDTAWVRRYHTPGQDSLYEAHAIAVDDSGNVYVTGYGYDLETQNKVLDLDYATIKYCPNGDTAWVRKYNGPEDGDDYAHAVAVDGFGNVYVTGCSFGGWPADYDIVTIKYSPCRFARGDLTGDGVKDVGDVVYLVNYLFRNGPPPDPWEVGDVNCDGRADVGNVVYLINYLYNYGQAPCC
jgi:hypothetical protein